MLNIETMLNTTSGTYQILNKCWDEKRKGVKGKEWQKADVLLNDLVINMGNIRIQMCSHLPDL